MAVRPRAARSSPQAQGNLLPARIKVSSSLSEDTIVAVGMHIASGENKVAMFANPFRDFSEEQLYIDVVGRLIWLRHSNTEPVGWETVDLGFAADEVAVAVHPSGSVFAFVLTTDRGVQLLRLGRPSPGGAPQWSSAATDLPIGGVQHHLSVQYLNVRPAAPFVFFVQPVNTNSAVLLALEPRIIGPDGDPAQEPCWVTYREVQVRPELAEPGARIVCGVEDAVDIPDASVRPLRAYWLATDARTTLLMQMLQVHLETPLVSLVATDVDELAGLMTASTGVGCVATRRSADLLSSEILVFSTVERTDGVLQETRVDHALADPVVWQDLNARLHVFGTVGDTLHVMHQVDTRLDPATGVALPVWEMLEAPVQGALASVAVARPLIADVAEFAVDTQPDEYPSQHVMHASGEHSERCAIYTQDVDSSWWSREVVRCPAQRVPYKVTRYKTQLTLVNALGGPVPTYPVEVTSDLPADVEVQGVFYRTGPNRPARLTTNGEGKLTLKVVARSLAGTVLHVTAKGLSEGVTVNPASELHDFFAGAGTLPNHPQGLTAPGLHDAKTPAGDYVFPAWHSVDHALAAVPDAEKVVDWLARLFAATSGAASWTTGADGSEQRVIAATIQTWDNSRPACELVTDPARLSELAAQRLVHPAFRGSWDDSGSWFGDVWQGIVDGVLRVKETFLDFGAEVATIFVEWANGVAEALTVAWDDLAGALRCAECIFNSLEAELSDLLDWAKWLFDLSDAMTTKDALLDGIRQWPAYVSRAADHLFNGIARGWFLEQEATVSRAIGEAKEQLAGVTFGADQPAPPAIQTKGVDVPDLVYDADKQRNPHAGWIEDQLSSAPPNALRVKPLQDVPPEFEAAVAAIEDLLDIFDSPGVGEELAAALASASELFVEMFDLDDPRAFSRVALPTMLDLVEHLVLAFLRFCEDTLGKLATVISTAIACIPAVLDMTIEDEGFLVDLWAFICDEAGRPATVPTLGDLFGFAAAYPITVVFKAVTEQLPFPDGTFPWLSAQGAPARAGRTWFPTGEDFTAPDGYPTPPLFQVAMQMIVGVCTGIFSMVDVYCDKPHVLAAPGDDTTESIKIAMITVFDLLAFGLGDLPIFYGVDHVWNVEGVEGLWWGEYFAKLPIYLGDIVVAWVLPAVKKEATRNILGTMQGGFGNVMISVLGWIETAFSIALLATSKKRPIDWIWGVVQLLSLVSSDSAFWRELKTFPDTFEYKIGLDVAADVVCGAWLTLMALVEWKTSVIVGTLPSTGRVGVHYRGGPLTRSNQGFPPIGWTVESGKLPDGLEFERLPGSDENSVWVSGTPTTPDTFRFTILAVNSYDPNMPEEADYTITINP